MSAATPPESPEGPPQPGVPPEGEPPEGEPEAPAPPEAPQPAYPPPQEPSQPQPGSAPGYPPPQPGYPPPQQPSPYPPLPPAYQRPSAYPPPPAGYQQQPGYPPPQGYPPPVYQAPRRTPEQEEQRRRTTRIVLIVVLAVLAVVVILAWAGCTVACHSIRGAVKEATKYSWTGHAWGWENGGGPADQGTVHYWGPSIEPQDKAPADAAKDEQSEQGLRQIHEGLERYYKEKGNYPYTLGPGGDLTGYVDPWPTNPWTGDPMIDSNHRGDFDYSVSGDEVDLTVVLSP